MKVIVNTSGFYGGTWFEASDKEVSMPDGVARAFLPPRGHQLSLPSSSKKAVGKAAVKPDTVKSE